MNLEKQLEELCTPEQRERFHGLRRTLARWNILLDGNDQQRLMDLADKEGMERALDELFKMVTAIERSYEAFHGKT